jgi:hypothetical protein
MMEHLIQNRSRQHPAPEGLSPGLCRLFGLLLFTRKGTGPSHSCSTTSDDIFGLHTQKCGAGLTALQRILDKQRIPLLASKFFNL